MNNTAPDSGPVSTRGRSGTSPEVTPIDGDETVYRASHDMTADGLSITISQAVAEVSGRPVTELVQDFSEYADPDALDRLFRAPAPAPDARNDGFVVLWIDGYQVKVHGDGRIRITDHTI